MLINPKPLLVPTQLNLPSYIYVTVYVYLSLGSINITTNNTEVLITDIGEDYYYPSLTCHTDLRNCCRNFDNNYMGRLESEWYYPDGRMVTFYYFGEGFYRRRNAQVIRLYHREASRPLSPTGSYCCVISTTGGEMTFCANIGECVHSVQW